jgi:FkbM family methyltransferase
MLKSLVRKALHRRGLDLSKVPNVLTFLDVHDVDLVLDVGANVGQYGRGLRELGYERRIWSFEPVKHVFDELQATARRDNLWKVTNTAVGAVPGEVTINVSEMSLFSSIKRANQNAYEFDSRVAVVDKQQVQVATLDDLLRDETAQNIYLKIDTQGFEQEVLQGAPKLLTKLAGLQLEIPVDSLYDDVWSFLECINYMDRLGYTPSQFKVVNAGRDDPASAVEFDCIFRRK